LNGTSNFVLEKIADGKSASEAIKLAQSEGYAEADPKFDLDGTDAAQKLSLLARLAFDKDLPFADIKRQSIKSVDDASLAALRARGSVIRVVAQCHQTAIGLEASVELIELDESHPLYSVRGVDNRLVIESETGDTWSVSGRGAGRWPTTEAVIADLFDVRRTIWSTSAVELREECVA
jgi:homoserine dehydrogenase